jgi:geranylgeranyl diphosphate synthase type II
MTASFDALSAACVQVLTPYQQRLSEVFDTILPEFQDAPLLDKACEYAMRSGGKRLRPALVWMVAEALGTKNSVDLAALAVEFFHISSLVTDDLPCMDNDDYRRGIPTVHKVFPEAIAVLTSFALTAAGFEAIARVQVGDSISSDVVRIAVLRASQAIGFSGLVGGQAWDLSPPDSQRSTLCTIIDKKTGALFELSFVLGWLFGGGDIQKIDDVVALAKSFGRAFQVVDDIMDVEQDRAANKLVNYAVCFGVSAASEFVQEELNTFQNLMKKLSLQSPPMMLLVDAMLRVATA